MKTIKIEFNINETNLVLKALSTLPFNQVNELIGKIQEQAKAQLEEKKEGETPQS